MRTEELIVTLARSAEPVTPLRPPLVRLATWMSLAFALSLAVVLLIGPRPDLAAALTRPAFDLSLLALVGAAGLGAASALILSVPGAERSLVQRIVPIVAVAAWPIVWQALAVAPAAPAARATGKVIHWACVAEIGALSGVAGAVLLAMIRRAAPLRPAWTASLVMLSAVSLAAASTQIICPIDAPGHQLAGHVVPAIVFGSAGALLGRALLRRVRPIEP